MEIIFSIPDDIYNNGEVQDIINNANSELGMIDERITCQDVPEKPKSEEPDFEQYDFVLELQDDLKDQGIESTILLEGNKIVDKIAETLSNSIYSNNGYIMLSGGFVKVSNIAALRYTKDGKEVIEFFARVEHGIADEDGKRVDVFNTHSKWTGDGEFIEHYD